MERSRFHAVGAHDGGGNLRLQLVHPSGNLRCQQIQCDPASCGRASSAPPSPATASFEPSASSFDFVTRERLQARRLLLRAGHLFCRPRDSSLRRHSVCLLASVFLPLRSLRVKRSAQPL